MGGWSTPRSSVQVLTGGARNKGGEGLHGRNPPGRPWSRVPRRLRQWGLGARSAVRQLAAERTPHPTKRCPTGGSEVGGWSSPSPAVRELAGGARRGRPRRRVVPVGGHSTAPLRR